MNSQEFIDAVIVAVTNTSLDSVRKTLESPPGRQPQQELVETSKWFNSLSQEEKSKIESIINMSVNNSVFGMLCVLDGVKVIEDDEEKGDLKLYYEKNNQIVLLNPQDGMFLHDLYMSSLK